MKKILSALIVAAMLASLVAAIGIPAAAIDGDWIVYSKADHYMDDYTGDIMSIPGYEYTADGLRVIPADWRDFTPGAGVQTKEKVDLKEGVYMEVRVDEFSNNSDFWFNFNIWSKPMFKAGKTDTEKWGYGVQELIRSNSQYSSWRYEWKTGGFDAADNSTVAAENSPVKDDGCLYFTFEVSWNGSSYALSINNTPATQKVIDYMNKTYAQDSEAYIGFNLQNGTKDGDCGLTVLKFGTSKDKATVPQGDDSRDPENFYLTIADIASPDTVEEGKPAIFMNGNRAGSDVKQVPEAANGTSTINDDYSIRVVASTSTPYVGFAVANDVSYDIKDFPVALVLVRDLCTCGEEDGTCYALESSNLYLMCGEITAASADCKINEIDMCEAPLIVDGHSYLYFYYEMTEDAPFKAEGRINSVRFDFAGVDVNTAGKNAFDLCFSAFFRNVDEAEAFVREYIDYKEPQTSETTPATSETEPDTTDETTVEVEDTTKEDVATTEEKEPAKTEEKSENKTDAPKEEENKGGCGSVVGFSAIAVISMAAAGVVSFKKRH